MPTERTFDSGIPHSVVTVRTVDGDFHNVAMPADGTFEDLYKGLATDPATYMHDLPSAQPTKEGSFEYSDSFKRGIKAIVDDTVNGAIPNREAGVAFDKNGNPGKVFRQDTPPGEVPKDKITYMSSDFATAHTHPRKSGQGPSPQDVKAAITAGKTFYVVGQDGLFAIDGRNHGLVTHVFQSPDFYKQVSPK